MPVGPFGREAAPETRRLIDAILLSEWAVPALLCFLHAARDGLPFFTRCPDPYLASRNGNEPGERGSLFRLSPGLLQLIRTVGMGAILEGTTFDPAGAETILDFSERLDWSLPERGDFVWYSWTRRCSLRIPHWDGTSREANDWYEPLPDAGAPSYGAVIASGDGWGAAVTSAKPPVEPSTESSPVMASPPSPVPGEAGGTEGSPDGPSTPPEVVAPAPVESPAEVEELPVVVPPPVVPYCAGPTVEPAVLHPPGVASAAVPYSAALLISDMTGRETQTPSMVAEGAPAGASSEEASAAVPGAQAALRALQVECGYTGMPTPPTLAVGLVSARAWLVEVTQFKAPVAGLQFAIRQRDTGDDLLRGETMARIRAAQDHLAVLSEQVTTKRPYGAVEADPAGTAPQGSEPSAKRQRHD